MFSLRVQALALAACLGLGPVTQAASMQAEQFHPEYLQPDPSLGLAEVVDAALERWPEIRRAETLRDSAEAWREVSSSWLGDNPRFNLDHVNGALDGASTRREWEAALELPLRPARQRDAEASISRALSAEAKSQMPNIRLQLAGEVRRLLWAIERQERLHELARNALEVSQRLAHVVERRVELGDRPRTELIATREAVMARKSELLRAEAGLMRARYAFQAFTGLQRMPSVIAETQSKHGEITLRHPALQQLQQQRQTALARMQQARALGRGQTMVSLGLKREEALDVGDDDSFTVGLSLPLNVPRLNAPALAEANQTLVAADIALMQKRRELELALHEALHEAEASRREVNQSLQRYEMSGELLRMSRTAFDLGEIDLSDYLLVQRNHFDARREFELNKIRLGEAVAAYNQAVGELP